MKTNDEMISDLFERRRVYVKRRNTAAAIGGTALAVMLAFGGIAVFGSRGSSSGIKTDSTAANIVTSEFAALQTSTSTTAAAPTVSPVQDDVKLITAAVSDTSDEGFTEWNGRNVYYQLLEAFEKNSDNDLFAVGMWRAIDPTFVYEGKTIAQYGEARELEYQLKDKLGQLIKEGESLKYGTKLYEGGAPEKWYKGLYEERVSFYGQELLDKYIVNGEFLKAQAEQDWEAAEKQTAAQEKYDEAVRAYYTALGDSVPGEQPEGFSKSGVVRLMTKSEFLSFEPDDLDSWHFSLAIKDTDAEQYGQDE